MEDLLGQKVICAVAQQPFETPGDGDVMNMFGTLAPLVLANGDQCEEADFPNAGLVWWMLRPGIRNLAAPGRLLKGTLEQARRYDPSDPLSKYYQVHKDSVSVVEPEDVVEILTVEDDIASEPHHFLGNRVIAQLNRPAAGVVLIRWRGKILGPFRTTSSGEGVIYEVRLGSGRPDQTVTIVAEDEFSTLVGGGLHHCDASVSIEPMDRLRAEATLRCTYELVIGPALQRFQRLERGRVRLETDVDVVKRLARQLMSRRERQTVIEALTRLEEHTRGAADVSVDDQRVLGAVRERTEDLQGEINALAAVVVQSGLLEDRLRAALEDAAQRYVESNVERLNAEVQRRLREEVERLEQLRADASEVQLTIETQARRASEELQTELSARREEFTKEVEGERQRMRHEREQQLQVQSLIQDTLQHLREERGQVLSAALTTLSLLGESVPRGSAVAPDRADPKPAESAPLEAPAFVSRAPGPGLQDEVLFFERFRQHVERRGFRYREIDLASFHLSAKSADITILSGLSGIGKSSLPRLYAESLAGDTEIASDRYLEVSVSPSWLDMRDLLGYVNTLDRRFQPSESGLFPYLVWAEEEHSRKGLESGVHIVNLDEMNLSQVEHYFSGFLQALERPTGSRLVACFAPQTIGDHEPFRRWARLNLPPSLRFVGTVNMDETTKQLSLRLLDRANLIRLRPHAGTSARMDIDDGVRPSGPPVLLRNLRSWVRPPLLPPELAEMMDEVKRGLTAVGAAVSPRRQRAIATFVSSAPREICSPEAALDLQIAQRVLPQLRRTLAEDARDGMVALLTSFERRESSYPESTRAVRELVDRLDEGFSFTG